MKLTIAMLVAAAPLSIISIHASSADLFSWLDSGKNTPIVQKVKKAFSDELRPDIPEKVKPYVPIPYKYLAHIGVYKTSCLVIYASKAKRGDNPKWLFRISKASSNPFWIWLPMGENLNEILVGSQEGCC